MVGIIILTFVWGLSGGYLCKYWFDKYLDSKYIKIIYEKPLLELMNKGLGIYRFHGRDGEIVTLNFNMNSTMYLYLQTKKIVVYDGNKFSFETHMKTKKDSDILFDSLINKFYNEIFIDISTIYGKTYSNNNIFVKILMGNNEIKPVETKYNIDDLLDKINVGGIESLSEDERKFLNIK